MILSLSILSAGLSFLFLAVLFWPLEKLFAAKEQPLFRPQWWTDLAFFLGQYLLWGGCVIEVLQLCRGWIDAIIHLHFREFVGVQPCRFQGVEVVFLLEHSYV